MIRMRTPFPQHLAGDTQGSVFVEYLVVLAVAIVVALALARIGPNVVRGYAAQQQNLYRSNP